MKKIKEYFKNLSKSNKILYSIAAIGLILGLSFAGMAGGGFLVPPLETTMT